jgi:hypothetical protein
VSPPHVGLNACFLGVRRNRLVPIGAPVANYTGGRAHPLLRRHWGIENSPYWVHDITYDEVRTTTHIDHSAQVMASLRNTAIKLHRLDGAANIAEACRATALTASSRLDLLNPRNPSS